MSTAIACCRYGVILGWLVGCTAAHAAWLVEPSAELRTEYDSNVRLDSRGDEDRDAIVSSATAQVSLRSVTERSEVNVLGGVNYITFGSYSGPANLDDRDYEFARVMAERRTERGDFGIVAMYRRDDLFRQVYVVPDGVADNPADGAPPAGGDGSLPDGSETPGVTDPPDVDVNTVPAQVRRSTFGALPHYRHSLGERTSATVSYRYLGIRIDEDVVGFADSDLNGVNLELARDLTEIDRGTLSLRVSNFDPGEDFEADVYEAVLGWSRRLGPASRLTIHGGVQKTEGEAVDESGFLVKIRAERRMLAGRVLADLERSVVPSAFGDLLEADRVSLRIGRLLSERWSAEAMARAFRTDSLLRRSEDRDYAEAGLEIRWSMTPALSVGMSYRYRWIERDLDAEDASGHVAGLSLAYRPPSLIGR